MTSSPFLAQLMGLFGLGMGLSMLVRRKMLLSIFHELSENRATTYIMGVIIFLLGLIVVLQHNVWEWGSEPVITIIGWAVLIEGAAYLFVSKSAMKHYIRTLDNARVYYLIALGYLVLSGYLLWTGFSLN